MARRFTDPLGAHRPTIAPRIAAGEARLWAATNPDPLERDWQTFITRHAHAAGWLAYHTHDSRRSQHGYPDLTLVHTGHECAALVELKRNNTRSRPTAEQVRWLDALATVHGLHVALWRPAQAVETVAWLHDPTRPLPGLWPTN